LAFTLMRLTDGVWLASCETSVSENGPAPLLSVASIVPSGDSARPNGFGACTFTSVPAGVTSRPFGRIAAWTPSTIVSAVAGPSPAGAENLRKSENRPSESACAAIAHAPSATITLHDSTSRALYRPTL